MVVPPLVGAADRWANADLVGGTGYACGGDAPALDIEAAVRVLHNGPMALTHKKTEFALDPPPADLIPRETSLLTVDGQTLSAAWFTRQAPPSTAFVLAHGFTGSWRDPYTAPRESMPPLLRRFSMKPPPPPNPSMPW